jgi:hypothetical protein
MVISPIKEWLVQSIFAPLKRKIPTSDSIQDLLESNKKTNYNVTSINAYGAPPTPPAPPAPLEQLEPLRATEGH